MTTSSRGRSGALRPMLWLAVGFVAAQAYLYSAALLGHGPPGRPLPVPLFIPQAVALAALLRAPRRDWWLLLGEYGLLLTGQTIWVRGPLAWQNHLSNIGDLLEALLGALLLCRLIAIPPRFDALREVGRYAAAVLLAAAAGATWGAGVRLAWGGEAWPFWRAWFLSDALASLLLAPAILLWVGALADRSSIPPPRRLPEVAALLVALLAAGFVAFDTRTETTGTATTLLYLAVSPLLWAAIRFGPLGLTMALSLLTVVAVAAVANGLGPFADRTRDTNVYTVQVFLLAISLPCLTVAALVLELRLARAALARSEALYRAAVTNFPRGAVLLFGADLRPLLTGGAGLPSIQPRSSAVLGTAPPEVFPPEMAQELTPSFRSALAGESSSVDVRRDDRTYRAEVVPVSGAGSAVGLAVVQDVTEERRAALLAAVERARTALDDVRLHPTAPPDDPVAHTLEVAVRLAEALAPEFGEPPAAAGDELARVRWLLERLLAPGPEDDELLALLGWFATTHDVRKALEALMKQHQPPE